MNKLMIMGKLGADAKLTYLENGSNVINFDVAVNESYKNKGVEKVTNITWYEVELWNKPSLFDYLKKGDTVAIEGTARADAYINKEGNAVAKLGITVDELYFV